MSNIKNNNKKNNAGFTLIELTFVILIFGLLIAMFSPLYNLYLKNQAELTTQQNTQLLISEITEFLTVNGRYPCPAPPAVAREDIFYGRESTECADTAELVTTSDCQDTTLLDPISPG